MADFVLSCCSTADLTKEHFQQRDISYICFHYALDGVDYPDDLGESMPFDKFYAAMANGAETRTSQVNISEFVDYFTPFLEQGKDILHVCGGERRAHRPRALPRPEDLHRRLARRVLGLRPADG